MEEEEKKEAERERAELAERASGITSMGFSLERAIRAMELKGGDIEAAVEYLLMEGEGDHLVLFFLFLIL